MSIKYFLKKILWSQAEKTKSGWKWAVNFLTVHEISW